MMNISNLFGYDDFSGMLAGISAKVIPFGLKVIGAIIIFVVGRFAIKMLDKGLRRLFEKRSVDKSVAGFVVSLTNISLLVLLILTIIGSFGVSITSFAALLASAGVAFGMALSGNLQNFAGGLMMLIFKPYQVGDYIKAQDNEGFVKDVQIFHTIIRTYDNKLVYIPNGALSNGVIRNYSRQKTLRIDWTFGVGYGEVYDNVKQTLLDLVAADERILKTPEPFVALDQMADSSVNILLRVWVESSNYWAVYYDMNEKVYAKFNEKGIDIPFPQVTVHQGK